MSGATREAAAERMLAQNGMAASRVRAVGHRAEIALVEVHASSVDRLRELAPRLKAFGFDYIALDLVHSGDAA